MGTTQKVNPQISSWFFVPEGFRPRWLRIALEKKHKNLFPTLDYFRISFRFVIFFQITKFRNDNFEF